MYEFIKFEKGYIPSENLGHNKVKVGDTIFTLDKSPKELAIKYCENGCFIISACRGEYNREDVNGKPMNLVRTEELKKDLKNFGCKFIRTCGGYSETDADNNSVNVFEMSFIVLYNNSKTEKEFVEKAVELCNKYEQESVLIAIPNFNGGKPSYVNKQADIEKGWGEFDTVENFQEGEPYFTELKPKRNPYKKTIFGKYKKNEKGDFIQKNKQPTEKNSFVFKQNVSDMLSKYVGLIDYDTINGIRRIQDSGELLILDK